MVPEYPTRIARIGSVATLLGSLIWVQWPIDFEKLNAAAVILLIGSLMAWASIELADHSGRSADNIMSDDVDKLNKILTLVDSKQFYILKNKAIQTYMDDDDYEGLRRVISLRDNDIFPFHNQRIQTLYEKFCEDARDFCSDFYDLFTSDGRGNSTWRPSGDRYVDDEVYSKVMTKIAFLDRKTSKLAASWEEFISASRQELKGASKAIDRYDM